MNAATIQADDDTAAILGVFRSELRNPSGPLSLLVRFTVHEGQEDRVETAFGRARPQTLGEPGCCAYELHQDPRTPHSFVVYERWRSLADLEAHFRKDYFATVRNEIGALIVAAPEFQVLLPTA
ncbi:putative quinol monooxygenase [Rudaea cellulosilytica]|uniref:putative quinol monooxygenase n=1 Tax=Rudaea cellulosilytica TaxID=540746 RepID=UPI000377F3BA|nr:putative quinol monooxygenase [Rudaea cellulosilytica]